MNRDQLAKVAQAMVAPGKGILAADESSSTIKKRFDAIKTESTEDSRRDYREFMFRSELAMRQHISGVILYDETIRQKAKDGTPLVKVIESMGSIPGIKVDAGAQPMPMFPGETITEGLDGLPQRMRDYYDLGARFAEMARRDHDRRRRPPDRRRRARQHAGLGPLRRDLPGGRYRADRRARSAHGRRP